MSTPSSASAPHVDLTMEDINERLEAQKALGDVLEDVKEGLKDGKEGVYIELCKATMQLSNAKSGASIERVNALESQLDIAVYNGERQRGRKRWARRDANSAVQYVLSEHGVESATKMILFMKKSQQSHKRRMLSDVPSGVARDNLSSALDEELAEDTADDDEEGGGQHIGVIFREITRQAQLAQARRAAAEAVAAAAPAAANVEAQDSNAANEENSASE